MSNHLYHNLTGERFSRLIALEPVGIHKTARGYLWRCLCDCGKETVVLSAALVKGNTRSCGCLKQEYIKNVLMPRLIGNIPPNRTHNQSKAVIRNGKRGPTTEYRTYRSMISRCKKGARLREFRNYYAMGIKVCDRWLGKGGFENFIKDMGKRPENMSLDRKDPYKNYESSNCRWADVKIQASNKKKEINIRHLTYNQNEGFQINMELN